MDHSPGFLKMVEDARPRVRELTLEEARARLTANPAAVLMDVREDSEWAKGHADRAMHLGKACWNVTSRRSSPTPIAKLLCIAEAVIDPF